MREKHYDFWLHAKEGNQPKPALGFKASAYQRLEQAIISLSHFAQQREAAQQQE